ncbi:MAG: serine/threonine-protein kinase [Chloroflexaceae bacterium]
MHSPMLFTDRVDHYTEQQDYRDHVSTESGFQALLDRDVVIRRLRGEAAAHPRIRSRFVNEIKGLASLSHHAFVRVYDAGMRDEAPFAVCERLHGVTLQHRLDLLAEQRERMSLDEATHIVQSMAEGLEHARRRGVQVYDLTPGNIVLAEDRRVVLTSLGQPLPDNLLEAPVVRLAYASPEQLFGLPDEGVSAIYGLGVLLAHLVCGRLPFEGNALSVLAQKQRSGSLPVLEDVRASLVCPYPLAAVIHRATLANPAERYDSIRSFRTALRESLTGRQARTSSGPHQTTYALSLPERPPMAAEEHAAPAFPIEARPFSVYEPATAARHVGEPLHIVPDTPTPPDMPATAEPVQVASATKLVTEEAHQTPATPDEGAAQVPGADKPELQAAIPYTLLIPLPDDQPYALPMTPERPALRQTLISPVHLVMLMILGMLAIGAALMFG